MFNDSLNEVREYNIEYDKEVEFSQDKNKKPENANLNILSKSIFQYKDTEKTFTKDGKEVDLNRSIPTLNATVSSGIKNSTTPNNKGNSNDKTR